MNTILLFAFNLYNIFEIIRTVSKPEKIFILPNLLRRRINFLLQLSSLISILEFWKNATQLHLRFFLALMFHRIPFVILVSSFPSTPRGSLLATWLSFHADIVSNFPFPPTFLIFSPRLLVLSTFLPMHARARAHTHRS